MGVKLNSELAAFFNTGDQPSEAEFGHLIDSMLPVPVVLPAETTALTSKATYQGRVLVVPEVASNANYTLPQPAAGGEWYKFIFGVNAASDAQDHEFTSTTALLRGTIMWNNTTANDNSDDSSDLAFNTSVHADNSNDLKITLNTPEAYEINFLSLSSTVWYVSGWCASANVLVIS